MTRALHALADHALVLAFFAGLLLGEAWGWLTATPERLLYPTAFLAAIAGSALFPMGVA